MTHEDERENRLVSDLLFLDDGRFVSANANEMAPDASTLLYYRRRLLGPTLFQMASHGKLTQAHTCMYVQGSDIHT